MQTRVMGQAKLCSWLLPTCLFCKLGFSAWVPHHVLRRPCSRFLKVLVCVLPVARASISIRVNQSALNSKCFYCEWKWWVCKEDRTAVKAAQAPWGTTAGYLLFANTPDSSDVSFEWLPFDIQRQKRNFWINSADQMKKRLLSQLLSSLAGVSSEGEISSGAFFGLC